MLLPHCWAVVSACYVLAKRAGSELRVGILVSATPSGASSRAPPSGCLAREAFNRISPGAR